MDKYCERCGENPEMWLTMCLECGEQLCELCMGHEQGFDFGECRRCKAKIEREFELVEAKERGDE